MVAHRLLGDRAAAPALVTPLETVDRGNDERTGNDGRADAVSVVGLVRVESIARFPPECRGLSEVAESDDAVDDGSGNAAGAIAARHRSIALGRSSHEEHGAGVREQGDEEDGRERPTTTSEHELLPPARPAHLTTTLRSTRIVSACRAEPKDGYVMSFNPNTVTVPTPEDVNRR